jgi:hypothetical protein
LKQTPAHLCRRVFCSWHFSEVPPAASEGRSWLYSGLQQTARGRVYEFTPQLLCLLRLKRRAGFRAWCSFLHHARAARRELAELLQHLVDLGDIEGGVVVAGTGARGLVRDLSSCTDHQR